MANPRFGRYNNAIAGKVQPAGEIEAFSEWTKSSVKSSHRIPGNGGDEHSRGADAQDIRG